MDISDAVWREVDEGSGSDIRIERLEHKVNLLENKVDKTIRAVNIIIKELKNIKGK